MKFPTRTITATFAAIGLSLGLAATAPAQVGIYIGRTPPPLRYEARPAIPGPGYVWVDGFWQPNGNRYQWVAGHWNRPPYDNGYWNHPHYDHYQQGWQYHEGHWDHEDQDHHHDDHH